MTLSRRIAAAALAGAASVAIAVSAAGPAAASGHGLLFPTAAGCQAHGNKLAQQGKIHNFYCSKNIEAGTGRVSYELHITG
ncbi:hypothetical protein [Amycolatopsis sp. WGS_07]|uniref:hypothetical protein n=1 Tax=Amycolatopsis sp. WGS_07 TaxID=3076764 RepID=UPI00387315BF